ncbi:MAG: serine/threonine protein kinase [Enterobacteriaceae bacterium]
MTKSAFHFTTLQPELILDGVEQLGLRVDSGLTELNSYENRVYRFVDEDQKRWVVKFYRPQRWSREQILEEHAFCNELAQLEIPVVAPALFHQESLHSYQGFMFTLFPCVGGRQYEMDNESQLEWVGRFMGRIHQVGRQYSFTCRPTLSLQDNLLTPSEIIIQSTFIPGRLRQSIADALSLLAQWTTSRWNLDWSSCRLHGDCHPGNILWHDGPLFVDFDDARNGPAVQDMWMLLHGSRREQRLQVELFLEEYSAYSEFNLQELSLIEPLRSMRMVSYLAWIIQRWQDSAFPRSFPWIAEADFWQQQLSRFQEQITQLQEPPLQLQPQF